MKRLLLYWLSSLLTVLSLPLRAQTLDPGFAATSMFRTANIEAAAQQADGKLVVSGTFIRVNGTAASGIVRLNPDGTLDPSFSLNVQGSAQALAILPGGQIVAATTTSFVVGGQTYRNVLKINADGTLASGFSPGAGASSSAGSGVRAMSVQPDGKVLLGGTFTSYNGVTTPRLVRLNADGSVDQAFVSALGNGFDSDIAVLKLQADGKILVGGRFTSANGSSRRHLVRLLSTGALDTGYNPVSSSGSSFGVMRLALDPVTGQAVAIGLGQSTFVPMRLNLDGSVDPTFQAQNVSSSNCLTVGAYANAQLAVDASRSVLLSRGCNTGGISYLVRYTANGTYDNLFDLAAAVNGPVNVLLPLSNSQMLIGGDFNRFNVLSGYNLLMVSSQAVPSATFQPTLDAAGMVNRVLQQPDGKLLVGGLFREINGLAAVNLVRLNTDGTLDSSFGTPNFDGPVDALALQPDGNVVVAGAFTRVGSVVSPMLARLLPSGSVDPTFQMPAITSPVYAARAVAVQPDGKILLAASSGASFGGLPSTLQRFLPTGQLDAAYAQTTGIVSGISDVVVLPDGRHYVAGGFASFAGQPAEGLVRLLPDGSFDPTFTRPLTVPAVPYISRMLVADNGQLVLGGAFSSYGGLARSSLVRLQSNGQIDPALNAALISSTGILPLYVQSDGKVIIGSASSHFMGGVDRGTLSRLNADGSRDNTFVGGPGLVAGAVLSGAVQPDGKLVIGGFFTTVAGQPRMGVARLLVPNVLRVTPAQAAARTAAWPVPAHGTLHLRLDADLRPQQLALYDALGRRVLTQPAGRAAEQTLSVQGVRPGVYLLRVEYAQGVTATRRVVVE